MAKSKKQNTDLREGQKKTYDNPVDQLIPTSQAHEMSQDLSSRKQKKAKEGQRSSPGGRPTGMDA